MTGRQIPETEGKASKSQAQRFAAALLRWNRDQNRRVMPWKGEKDPYRIWLSEVILQQTRVEQGLKYYQNFIDQFPDVQALAAAEEGKVFKLWEGLGYYSRCRNLIASARYISSELDGKFPTDFESILKLKGVGSYTASAIASFAYNLPYAVLDGNVFRVLSRIYDEETPIDTAEGKKKFTGLAALTLPKEDPGEFNQAIMDFGATICKPVPDCAGCFFKDDCAAYRLGKQDLLPVKEKKARQRKRWLNYLVLRHKNEFAIRQRKEKDIWQSLHEFLLVETEEPASVMQLRSFLQKQYGIGPEEYLVLGQAVHPVQKLSHQVIHFSFIRMDLSRKMSLPEYHWVPESELRNYAFPRTLQQFIANELDD